MSYAFISMADPHQVVQFHKINLMDKLPKALGLINIFALIFSYYFAYLALLSDHQPVFNNLYYYWLKPISILGGRRIGRVSN